jgi:hypothetical protein
MIRKALFLFVFISFNIVGLSQDLFFPLKRDIVSAIPLSSEEAEIGFLFQDKNNFYFSIKDNNRINYWSLGKENLSIKRIGKIKKRKSVYDKIKGYQLKNEGDKLLFFYKKKPIWKRYSPMVQIINYYFNGKILIVLFKNGLLNIFSKNGTLEYWKTLDYKAKYIIDTEKGVFIFSETAYYYYDKKEKLIKKGKLNIKLTYSPIMIGDSFYVFGKKKGGDYFIIEKLSSKIGFEIDYDKPVYFKGDKIKIKIKIFNLKNAKISIDLTNDNNTINLIKNSKKLKYTLYLPFSGKTELIFYLKAKEGKYKISLSLNIHNKEKEINKLLFDIYKKCYIFTEEK